MTFTNIVRIGTIISLLILHISIGFAIEDSWTRKMAISFSYMIWFQLYAIFEAVSAKK